MKAKLNLNNDGTFRVNHVDSLSYLYFPLTNMHSMKSAISPNLNGNATIDQNTFALVPNSSEDLQNSLFNRNLYVKVNDSFTWSITGNSAYQIMTPDTVSMEADFLVHRIIRKNALFQAIIESFVPFNDRYQELHKVSFKNTSDEPLKLKPVVSIPLYSRSADNLRDHRHVTSLLNRVEIFENAIINKPTFSFDERGHNLNQLHYGVGVKSDLSITNYWPLLEEFEGEGHNLFDPLVVKEKHVSNHRIGDVVTGGEMTGAFEYEEVILQPKETLDFIITIIIDEDKNRLLKVVNNLSISEYEKLKTQTLNSWRKELETLQVQSANKQYNGWLKWVTLQPILRRIYGNSFMPHHDYGRGGRGWRDLWQDLLALILMNPKDVRSLLLNNFIGVRIDGSNATIIGEKPGEFVADRNNIARVWMDHGSWPLLTTMLYVDKTGDHKILLEKQLYFHDKFSHYTKVVNEQFNEKDNILKDQNQEPYKGTVLEHLILQNLVPFYNVGNHNNLRLEDADWNDALDMAHKDGESVAFTSLYGYNLIELSKILKKLHSLKISNISLLEEMELLLTDVDYANIGLKKKTLKKYFDKVANGISGNTIKVKTLKLSEVLLKKGNDLLMQVRENEFMSGQNGAWFNGYYDGDSNRLENIEDEKMTLTGQVFAIFGGSATDDQILKIIESADKYLYDPKVGGYKLNTDFDEIKLNMGRLFGFAYGHKENGAMFSHMAVMYANALYKRGFVHAGNKVLSSIFNHCNKIESSKIYPGIPEYVDPRGRGVYHYLTGSASWFILTVVTEVFGVKADFGKLILEPKLTKAEFDDNNVASITTLINNKVTTINYINENKLDFGSYKINQIYDEANNHSFTETKYGAMLESADFGNVINVILK